MNFNNFSNYLLFFTYFVIINWTYNNGGKSHFFWKSYWLHFWNPSVPVVTMHALKRIQVSETKSCFTTKVLFDDLVNPHLRHFIKWQAWHCRYGGRQCKRWQHSKTWVTEVRMNSSPCLLKKFLQLLQTLVPSWLRWRAISSGSTEDSHTEHRSWGRTMAKKRFSILYYKTCSNRQGKGKSNIKQLSLYRIFGQTDLNKVLM